MCLIERSRRSLSRRAQYASYVSLGMDEWLIRKPVKREVAEMESQKGSTAVQNTYPTLSTAALKVLLSFTTSYMCEIGFSAMIGIKTKL
ncbi:hypothetical protein T09_14313 [Trichinella sp. T9]|nr:hypothetical protein T09_14313 [Trichinella sp. T9]